MFVVVVFKLKMVSVDEINPKLEVNKEKIFTLLYSTITSTSNYLVYYDYKIIAEEFPFLLPDRIRMSCDKEVAANTKWLNANSIND